MKRTKFVKLLKKYRHAWVFGYILIYLPWFLLLERLVSTTSPYHVIYSRIDDVIPFNEYFIVPYLLWFVFIAAVFLYFFFTDVPGFYRLALMMFSGMTIFLIISTLYPNGLHLRPAVFIRENGFMDMVRSLYKTDTPTNVFPSIHVFNSLTACIAIYFNTNLRKHNIIRWSAYILGALIILATMFLKQHSVVDVTGAVIMTYTLYLFIYAPEKKPVKKPARQPV